MPAEDFNGSVTSYLGQNSEAREVFHYVRNSDNGVQISEAYDELDVDKNTIDEVLHTLEGQNWVELTDNGYEVSDTGGL